MGMLHRLRNNRRRTQLAIEVKRMTPFIHAPTVILPASDQVNCFPEVLAVVACPDRSGFWINTKTPRISQTVGPLLRSRIRHPNKWIVSRLSLIHISEPTRL